MVAQDPLPRKVSTVPRRTARTLIHLIAGPSKRKKRRVVESDEEMDAAPQPAAKRTKPASRSSPRRPSKKPTSDAFPITANIIKEETEEDADSAPAASSSARRSKAQRKVKQEAEELHEEDVEASSADEIAADEEGEDEADADEAEEK